LIVETSDQKGTVMLKWLNWWRTDEAQRPEPKFEAQPETSGENHAARAAVAEAKEQWDEDGDRADQDYYHVPGAGNPDRNDPPVLDGKPLPKPKPKRTTAHARRR
jgi:hypothetical protein